MNQRFDKRLYAASLFCGIVACIFSAAGLAWNWHDRNTLMTVIETIILVVALVVLIIIGSRLPYVLKRRSNGSSENS